MARKEITVTFNTITPLWTGDAWQDNSEIRPSSLIGSLRFWFEVICYFYGLCKIEKENNKVVNFKDGRFEKKVNREDFEKRLLEKGNKFEAKIESLNMQDIPLPSIIFGTTNWKSLIEIEKIEFDENNFKEEPRGRILPNKNFFWASKSYYGNFTVIFKIEEEILKPIFYPLLTFMEQYGFWGGKWNIGYGRLEIKSVQENNQEINNWRKEDFELFDNNSFSYNSLISTKEINLQSQPFEFIKEFLNIDRFYCKKEREIKVKISNIPSEIKILKIQNLQDTNIENLIKELLKKKIELRNCLKPDNSMQDKDIWDKFRHKLLGEQGEGSKIFPYIYKEVNGEDQLKSGGFLSIAGLLNLEKEVNSNGTI